MGSVHGVYGICLSNRPRVQNARKALGSESRAKEPKNIAKKAFLWNTGHQAFKILENIFPAIRVLLT